MKILNVIGPSLLVWCWWLAFPICVIARQRSLPLQRTSKVAIHHIFRVQRRPYLRICLVRFCLVHLSFLVRFLKWANLTSVIEVPPELNIFQFCGFFDLSVKKEKWIEVLQNLHLVPATNDVQTFNCFPVNSWWYYVTCYVADVMSCWGGYYHVVTT